MQELSFGMVMKAISIILLELINWMISNTVIRQRGKDQVEVRIPEIQNTSVFVLLFKCVNRPLNAYPK